MPRNSYSDIADRMVSSMYPHQSRIPLWLCTVLLVAAIGLLAVVRFEARKAAVKAAIIEMTVEAE